MELSQRLSIQISKQLCVFSCITFAVIEILCRGQRDSTIFSYTLIMCGASCALEVCTKVQIHEVILLIFTRLLWSLFSNSSLGSKVKQDKLHVLTQRRLIWCLQAVRRPVKGLGRVSISQTLAPEVGKPVTCPRTVSAGSPFLPQSEGSSCCSLLRGQLQATQGWPRRPLPPSCGGD